jgi:putative intracellular protease/amidase
MFDLANDEVSHALIREFYAAGKVVSAVCHSLAALVNVKMADGSYLIAGQEITGLSDIEEDFMQFTSDMPFLLEAKLRKNGGVYVKADSPFGVKVVTSGKGGKLVTGQNPPSAAVIGDALIKATGL